VFHASRCFICNISPPPISTLFPYTTLFRSAAVRRLSSHQRRQSARRTGFHRGSRAHRARLSRARLLGHRDLHAAVLRPDLAGGRSEEHTSELQSRENLVCRLLLEKKKYKGT